MNHPQPSSLSSRSEKKTPSYNTKNRLHSVIKRILDRSHFFPLERCRPCLFYNRVLGVPPLVTPRRGIARRAVGRDPRLGAMCEVFSPPKKKQRTLSHCSFNGVKWRIDWVVKMQTPRSHHGRDSGTWIYYHTYTQYIFNFLGMPKANLK